MGVKLVASSGGSVELVPTNTASNFTVTVPAATGTMLTTASTAVVTQAMLSTNVAGNGPAFSIYATGTTSVPTATYTKVTFNGTEFDTTGGMVASSRFTPTVAGYYYITASVYFASGAVESFAQIFRNGVQTKRGTDHNSAVYSRMVNAMLYLNGSTDYIEIYTYQASGSTINVSASLEQTFFQAFLARAA